MGTDDASAKKVGGVLAQGFLWDDRLRIIAELDGAGNVVSRFVYGNRVNVPEYMIRGADTYRINHRFISAACGFVVKLGDGSVAQGVDYDEFGIARLVSGTWLVPVRVRRGGVRS